MGDFGLNFLEKSYIRAVLLVDWVVPVGLVAVAVLDAVGVDWPVPVVGL